MGKRGPKGPIPTSFKPGTSGNPSGKPKDWPGFRELCRQRTPEALAALTEALSGGDSNALTAAKTLLEYGWGRPASAPEDREAQAGMAAQVSAALKAKSTDELVAFYSALTGGTQ